MTKNITFTSTPITMQSIAHHREAAADEDSIREPSMSIVLATEAADGESAGSNAVSCSHSGYQAPLPV